MTAEAKGHAWAVFLSAHAVLVARMEAALAENGLPPLGWYDVLWELEKADRGGLRPSELARRVVLSRPNLSRLADRLVEAGLVARSDSPDDGRGHNLLLTPQGRAMRKKMWPVYEAAIERYFGRHLSAAEARSLAAALSRAVQASK